MSLIIGISLNSLNFSRYGCQNTCMMQSWFHFNFFFCWISSLLLLILLDLCHPLLPYFLPGDWPIWTTSMCLPFCCQLDLTNENSLEGDQREREEKSTYSPSYSMQIYFSFQDDPPDISCLLLGSGKLSFCYPLRPKDGNNLRIAFPGYCTIFEVSL